MNEQLRAAKIALIAAGGTISMTRDGHTGKSVSTLHATELFADLALDAQVAVQLIDAPMHPGDTRQPDSLLQFARWLQTIADSTENGGVDGIVVSQGTDSMEDSVYFVDEALSVDIPVVCTGAMRPAWAAGCDGKRNVENAVRVACAVTGEYGTLVTMNDEIYPAWSVYKTDTTALDAFTVRRGSGVGRIFGDQVLLTWRPLPRVRFRRIPETLPSTVPILAMGVADDAALLGTVSDRPVHGLVIASIAAGSLPPMVYQRVLQVAEQGVPIVLCSSAAQGRTAEEYYYPHAYDELRAAGVMIEDWLSPRKTRIRLMLSIGLHEPYRPFGEEFRQSFAKRIATP
ncbi:MAG: asparaginase domain-containing protein [Candidatus Binatia bacterium]